MKEKLTKNDSVSNEQQEYDIAIAAFYSLLKQRGLFEHYFYSFAKTSSLCVSTKIIQNWEYVATRIQIKHWVSGLFIWDKSNVPHSVWAAFDYEWVMWCSNNLNH